jgi:acid stress-induced BolA-like protein IbaG/YrbA
MKMSTPSKRQLREKLEKTIKVNRIFFRKVKYAHELIVVSDDFAGKSWSVSFQMMYDSIKDLLQNDFTYYVPMTIADYYLNIDMIRDPRQNRDLPINRSST